MSKGCTLRFRKARSNAKQRLVNAGAINQFNEILNENVLNKERALFKSYAMQEYNIDADLILNEDTFQSNKVIFNDSAFRAIDVLRGKAQEDAIDTNTAKYLSQSRERQRFSPSFDPGFLLLDEQQPIDVNQVQVKGLTRLVTLKESLLSKARKKLAELKPQIRDNKDNLSKYKELVNLQKKLTDYVEGNESEGITGLVSEIASLREIDTRVPELIAPYIEKELERLQELVKSNDTNLTSEAKEIIVFIKDMAEFSPVKIASHPLGHPLYHISELYNEQGDFLLNDSFTQPFKDWANRASEFERQLDAQNKVIFTNLINSNDKFKEFNEGKFIDYNELIMSGKGLKDISWIDMMVMDISAGIFSHNGIMPQVIKNVVENGLESQYAWAKQIQESIDEQIPEVEKELGRLGYTLAKFGLLGVKGVSYDLFQQEFVGTNQSTGNIVHKFSQKWFDDKSAIDNKFYGQLQLIKDAGEETTKAAKFAKIQRERNDWYNENTITINPALLSAVVNNSEFSSLSEYFNVNQTEIDEYEQMLKDNLGEDFFNKTVESQLARLRQYTTQKQIIIDNLLQKESVGNFTELSNKSKGLFNIWETENNPFTSASFREDGLPTRIGNVDYFPKFSNNEIVPLKSADNGNYYDKKYATVEANPILKKFYETVYNATSEMKERLPYNIQEQMLNTSIPFLEKTTLEILLDKDLNFFQAISLVFRKMIDAIKQIISINVQDQFNFATVNPNTGLPDYQVNDSFISQNSSKIKQLFEINKVEFLTLIDTSSIATLRDISKATAIPINQLTPRMLQAISKYLGKNVTSQELSTLYGNSIPIGRILYNNAQHQVAQEKSFDLPKVIKLYSHLTAQYAARQEMLPVVELMRDNYKNIAKQITNNVNKGIINHDTKYNQLDGIRTNAMKQFDNWLERVVLGNYGLKKHYGLFKRDLKMSDAEQTDFLTKALSRALVKISFDGKVYSTQEKKIATRIKDIKSKLDPEKDKKEIEEIEKVEKNLGRDVAASAVIDSILNFIRFKGLGFNVSSGITNFVEGQVSNGIIAASGQYFNPEFLHEVSPSEMIAGDLIKQRSPGSVPEKVAKATYLAKAMDILQDNTNELQKASAKSAFSSLKRFNPYYQISKGEQYNQIPLMVATLKDAKIKSIEGVESNVWDSLEAKYNPTSKSWSVELKSEFKTEENIASWEKYTGTDYLGWKSKTKNVIINTHGDFSETSGMMAKSTHAGQIFLMFKTWMPREFYKRFAVEQDDLAAGIKGFKGRWRSHTGVTGAVQFGVMGGFMLGPVGGILGGTVGMALGHLYGAKSNLSLLQELALVNKMLVRKFIGMPVNMIGSVVGKKRLIKTNIDNDFLDKMGNPEFTKQDFNNFRANLQDISVMLMWFAFLLLTKSMLWDDDDEQEDPRRMAHNLLANKFMQLASSGMAYANVTEMGQMIVPAAVNFSTQVGKSVDALSKALAGEDTLLTGSNAGESRSINQLKKTFLPGAFQSLGTAGFGPQMERQFVPSAFDSYFFGEEKKAKRNVQEMKVEYRKELKDQDYTDEQIEDMVREKFPRRKKDQTYVEQLEMFEDEEELEEDLDN